MVETAKQAERAHLLRTAEAMAAAGRTAPKTKGMDRLETAILREYVLEPAPAPQVQTEKLLQEAWRRAVQAQMLAGRIDATQESLLMQGGLCILQAQSDCTELISRTLPLEAAD